jgi:hypothetical protein
MNVVAPQQGISAGVCARCGKSITHPGPDGECVRCLVSFGFLAEDDEVQQGSDGANVRLGPLRYAHFEVEVNAEGFPGNTRLRSNGSNVSCARHGSQFNDRS